MKKFLFSLAMVIGIVSVSQASIEVYMDGGETMSYYKVGVTSSTAVSVTAYGNSRKRVTCRNSGNVEVYLGSSTAVTAKGANSYEVGPSTTNAASMFATNNRSALFAIAAPGGAAAATFTENVYCAEERY